MDDWDVAVKTPSPFNKQNLSFPMSDTIDSNTCSGCFGEGRERCVICSSTGKTRCSNCFGRGRYNNNSGKITLCSICHATGQVPCKDCHGSGSVTCGACHGNRRSFDYQSVMIINFIHCSWLLPSHVMVLVKSLVIVLFLKKHSIKHQELHLMSILFIPFITQIQT